MKRVESISALLACGLGIGWLTGLSASPVIAAVVAGLLGLATTAAGAFAGARGPLPAGEDAKPEPHRRLDRAAASAAASPLGAASLVVGIAVGASVGVHARANDWLGADPRRIVAMWSGPELGLGRKQIAADLFRSLYPSPPEPRQGDAPAKPASPAETPSAATPIRGWLLAVPARDECERLHAADDSELSGKFVGSPIDGLRKLAAIQDPAILRKVANALCSASR